jgi:hypothetical protein
MTVETILLETLKFDLSVDLPYNLLLKYIKLLKGNITGSADRNFKRVNMAGVL